MCAVAGGGGGGGSTPDNPPDNGNPGSGSPAAPPEIKPACDPTETNEATDDCETLVTPPMCPPGQTPAISGGGCMAICQAGETYDLAAGMCVVDTMCRADQVISGSACVCPAGQVEVSGACMQMCAADEMRNPDGMCVARPLNCPDGTTVTPPATCPDSMFTFGTMDSYFTAETPTTDVTHGDFGNDIRTATRWEFAEGLELFHRRISGHRAGGLFANEGVRLALPPPDVREEWRAGWSGQGVNILINDDFGPREFRVGSCTSVSGLARDRGLCWDDTASGYGNQHGFSVSVAALQIAPRANIFGVNAGTAFSDTVYRGGGSGGDGVRDSDGNRASPSVKFGVANWSFGTDPLERCRSASDLENCIGSGNIRGWTRSRYFTDMLGLGFDPIPGTTDAVLTKSAGNDGADAGLAVENMALVKHSDLGQRTLIVGWLNRWGQNGNAALHAGSNFAGRDTDIQDRFLVEYGGSPFDEITFLCDRDDTTQCTNAPQRALGSQSASNPWGTSFAAPRVAGYAALVRHKFPNLTGPQTASLLLDTATTEGLSCHPTCPENRYGQGRVDIGAALSPVGSR